MTRKILEQAYAAETEFLALLAELVAHESPSSEVTALNALADRLQALLEERGFTTTRHARAGAGDIVAGHLAGGSGPSTLILCHYDTVWPLGTLATMPWRRDGDKVYGPGALDMKAGIANALTAVALAERMGLPLAGAVTLLLTSDEEVGSHHSRELIEELAEKHDRVFVMEPGRDDGALKVGRKGVGDFELHLKGRSAHAGNNPSDGASALRELAHMLLFVEDLADNVMGTSVNVTTARAGFATNVIAEEAIASVDVRVLKASEADRITQAINDYTPRDSRVTLTVTGGLNRPPMESTPQNMALYETAVTVLADMGLALEGSVVGGGSDGNFTSALGVPTLDGLGSAGSGPHARDEHIRVKETLERVALITGLLTRA
jgi:glutamate carboxypeptidase